MDIFLYYTLIIVISDILICYISQLEGLYIINKYTILIIMIHICIICIVFQIGLLIFLILLKIKTLIFGN